MHVFQVIFFAIELEVGSPFRCFSIRGNFAKPEKKVFDYIIVVRCLSFKSLLFRVSIRAVHSMSHGK